MCPWRDDNVHYQGTERLVNRLIELGKPFDTIVYPNRPHADPDAGSALSRRARRNSWALRFVSAQTAPWIEVVPQLRGES